MAYPSSTPHYDRQANEQDIADHVRKSRLREVPRIPDPVLAALEVGAKTNGQLCADLGIEWPYHRTRLMDHLELLVRQGKVEKVGIHYRLPGHGHP